MSAPLKPPPPRDWAGALDALTYVQNRFDQAAAAALVPAPVPSTP